MTNDKAQTTRSLIINRYKTKMKNKYFRYYLQDSEKRVSEERKIKEK